MVVDVLFSKDNLVLIWLLSVLIMVVLGRFSLIIHVLGKAIIEMMVSCRQR